MADAEVDVMVVSVAPLGAVVVVAVEVPGTGSWQRGVFVITTVVPVEASMN